MSLRANAAVVAVAAAAAALALAGAAADVCPVELVTQLAPFLNWPAAQIPSQAAGAACLVRSCEVRDEAVAFLDQARRSSMASACARIVAELEAESAPAPLLRRWLALASIQALFRQMPTAPDGVRQLGAAVNRFQKLYRTRLGLGSGAFVDILAQVFVRDAGRFLHRVVWAHHGVGGAGPDSDDGDVVEFARGYYLSPSRLEPLLDRCSSAPAPPASQLDSALIWLFRLIPFPDQIELLGAPIDMDEFHGLSAPLPASLAVSWASVSEAFHALLDRRYPNAAYDGNGRAKKMARASFEHRLARCVAVRVVLALLEHASRSALFAAIDIAAMIRRLQGRHFQELYNLFHAKEQIRADVLHRVLRSVQEYVDAVLLRMSQLNAAMFLARDRPSPPPPSSSSSSSSCDDDDGPDLAGFLLQQLPTIRPGDRCVPSQRLAPFLNGAHGALDAVANGRSAPAGGSSRFCRDLLKAVFHAADSVDPFRPDARLLGYQRSILSRLASAAPGADHPHSALLDEYVSLGGFGLAFHHESVHDAIVRRLKAMDNDVVLLRFMDDLDSRHRTQLILLRLADLRPADPAPTVAARARSGRAAPGGESQPTSPSAPPAPSPSASAGMRAAPDDAAPPAASAGPPPSLPGRSAPGPVFPPSETAPLPVHGPVHYAIAGHPAAAAHFPLFGPAPAFPVPLAVPMPPAFAPGGRQYPMPVVISPPGAASPAHWHQGQHRPPMRYSGR